MTYSKITAQDLPAWISLSCELFPHVPKKELEEYCTNQISASPEHFQAFKCVNESTEIVAYIEVTLRRDYVEGSSTSPVGYIEAIYVKPEFRHQGIARKLAEIGEEWAKERGCTEMASDTESSNADSQKFHKKIGFEQAETIVHFIKKVG